MWEPWGLWVCWISGDKEQVFHIPFSGFLEVPGGVLRSKGGQAGWPLASFLLWFHIFDLLRFHKMFFLKKQTNKQKKNTDLKNKHIKVTVLSMGRGGGRWKYARLSCLFFLWWTLRSFGDLGVEMWLIPCHLREVTLRSKDWVELVCYSAANGCNQLHPSTDIYWVAGYSEPRSVLSMG